MKNLKKHNKALKKVHFVHWDNLPLVLLTVSCPLASRYVNKKESLNEIAYFVLYFIRGGTKRFS